MDALTHASQTFITTFSSYINQFLQWGQWIFFSLLLFNLVFMCIKHAFDRHSFSESMPAFIRQFFVVSFFYTLMLHAGWLSEVLKTFQFMGNSLTHAPIDPSSLISQGIGIGNKIIVPIEKSSLLTLGFGLIIVAIVYLIVLFVFISIALDLALTLIMTTALIAVASFFLGFAALGATSQIARQTLDVILANCVKLLGIYLVVAAGSQTMMSVSNAIPVNVINFDAYAWIVSVALLFWLLAKNLPNQLARIVSGSIQEMRGTDAAALAMTTTNFANRAIPAVRLASGAVQGIAQITGATAYNAGAHFNATTARTGNPATGAGAAIVGPMAHLGKAVAGNVSAHFSHIASKLAGGPGSENPISSVAERLYKSAKDIKSQSKGK